MFDKIYSCEQLARQVQALLKVFLHETASRQALMFFKKAAVAILTIIYGSKRIHF